MVIEVMSFKDSGKYYTTNLVQIPDDTQPYLIPDAVREKMPIKNMIAVIVNSDRDCVVPHIIFPIPYR